MDRHHLFYETIQTALPRTPFTLVEYCCGSGTLGLLFSRNLLVERVVFVDVRMTRGLERTLALIKIPFEVSLKGIESYTPPSNSFVVALHACGTLTDQVIMQSLHARSSFAVVPCCYQNKHKPLQPSNPSHISSGYSRKEFYDALRMTFVREHSYEVQKQILDKTITPMNNLLIGVPQTEGRSQQKPS